MGKQRHRRPCQQQQQAQHVLAALLAAALCGLASGANVPILAPAYAPSPSLGPAVTRYDFNVALTTLAPDCFEKPMITVSGELSPMIEVVQGNILEVVVANNLPDDYPLVSEGISIHWHGFSMGGAEWYDGVGYLAQCPIRAGSNFTYRFQVNEQPGTYFWHGHSGMEKVDGLYGPLIVRPRAAGEEPFQYDEERILLLADRYHDTSASLTFPLNRPFDTAKMSAQAGGWSWVGVPQSILLNNQGFYGDCALLAGSNTAVPPKCNVTLQWVAPGRSSELPYAGADNPGCARYNMTVEAGKTYRVRMINAGSLAFLSVCFAGHNVTVVAADAYPINPLQATCVDINLGQRYDVLLKADQTPSAYWLSAVVVNGTRTGSPAGYGVLRYAGANSSELPAQPLLQPETVKPWPLSFYRQITLPTAYLNASTLPPGTGTPDGLTSLAVPNSTHSLFINLTQPLLPSGQLRWALNNVATYGTPACLPTLAQLKTDPSFMSRMASSTQLGQVADIDMQQSGDSYQVRLFLANKTPVPTAPVAGQEFMALQKGDVVDVILQNLAANANGGDYRGGGVGANRTAQEQHPFHLHGHHFWLLGQGVGLWEEVAGNASSVLNTANPPYRDSFTVAKGGWVVLRFAADNPGLWILHCHTDWHLFMGQKMYFATSPELAATPPADLPQCASSCMYNFGAFQPGYVAQRWGNTGYST